MDQYLHAPVNIRTPPPPSVEEIGLNEKEKYLANQIMDKEMHKSLATKRVTFADQRTPDAAVLQDQC